MNFLVLFLIPLASGSINVFEDSFLDPSISETKMFNELLEKFLKVDVERKDVTGILSTFEKPFVKTFACDASDVNNLVVNVVETRVGGFSVPEEMEKDVILGGTYTWQCKITTSEEGVITVDCDNSIKLNPDVISSGRKDPRVHETENIVILYHELLHGQLMLDAISSSEKWRNDVCNKTPADSIDLSYSDKKHEIIGPLQTEFTQKIVEQKGGLFVKEIVEPAETQGGEFSKKVMTRDESFLGKGIKVSFRALNIEDPSITFPGDDIFLSGSLIDPKAQGTAWLYIFDDSQILEDFEKEIPQWIKMNAGWWSQGTITDTDFLKGIEYLVLNDIIEIQDVKPNAVTSKEVPSWVRNTAKWWSEGLISDREFVSGIKYLIEAGIIAYQ